MAVEFKYAWDKKTGDKLPYKVPETHFDIFPDTLSPTPQQKRKDRDRSERAPQVSGDPAQTSNTEGDN